MAGEGGLPVHQQRQRDEEAQGGAGLPAVQNGGGPRLHNGIAQAVNLDGVLPQLVDPGPQGGEAPPGGRNVLGIRQIMDGADPAA